MKLLIAGGTSFIGRALALAAHAAGHDVAVINRGVTPNDLPTGIERLVGDRRGDLSALHGRHFDATIDTIAYRPGDVVALANALESRGGHHLQISSVSAYQAPTFEGLTEDRGVLASSEHVDLEGPIDAKSYGPLKAACERAAVATFDEPLTFIRPTFVVGAYDATLRFPYWVARLRRGGDVAVPGPRSNALQYVDARDLANFTLRCVEQTFTGAFHVAGPTPPARYVDLVERVARHVAPAGTRIIEVDPTTVLDANLADRFPLWSGRSSETLLAVDPAKALAHGLILRPVEESVDDVVAWWGARDWPKHWLGAVEERALLASVES
ncbi:MAG: NAD-dependent epimerase/dehydratase family protein [Acidobacteriota bacterium]|nr:NAD-dependent epimerase/dehydratase family protein [Acidobacteriota bacterium]